MAVRDPKGRYHAHLTDVPPDVLSAEDVAALYRARWEVELLSRELKSAYRPDQVETANEDVARGLLWTAVLTLLVSRWLFLGMRALAAEPERWTHGRWSRLFDETAGESMRQILATAGFELDWFQLVETYGMGVPDPNRNRDSLMDDWLA